MLWQEKEIFVTVLSEGVGGKVQVIGTQKVDLAKYISLFTVNPSQVVFKDTVNFPPNGLVGDLEVQIVLKLITNKNGFNDLNMSRQSIQGMGGAGLNRTLPYQINQSMMMNPNQQ